MSSSQQLLVPILRDRYSIENTNPDIDFDANIGLGTYGARQLTASLKQGFQLANKIDPGTKDFWFAGWVKLDSLSGDATCIWTGANADNDPGFSVFISATRKVGVSLSLSTTARIYSVFDTTIATGAWVFVCVTFDRSGDCSCYVNAVKESSTVDIAAYAGDILGTKTSNIGRNAYWGNLLDGSISRFCYGEGSLPTEAEIRAMYNSGQGLTYAELDAALEAKVTHYWNCMEACDGTKLVDLLDAKGSNDGTPVGGELLTDGGLENWDSSTNLTSWSEYTSGSAQVTQETSDVHEGSSACKTTIESDGFSYIYQGIQSGKTYDWSLYVKGSTDGYKVRHPLTNLLTLSADATWTGHSGTLQASIPNFQCSHYSFPAGTYVLWDSCSLKSPYIPSSPGPRQAVAIDSVGDSDGTLHFSDTISSWQSNTPDGSYTATKRAKHGIPQYSLTKRDSVGSNDGTMKDFDNPHWAHKDHNIGSTFGAIVKDSITTSGGLITTVEDSAGSADGTFYNHGPQNVSTDVPSVLTGYSGKFDGVDDYVDCGDNGDVGLGDVTYSAWVKTSVNDTALRGIVMKGTGSSGSDTIGMRVKNGHVSAVVYEGGGTYVSHEGSVTISDSTWHHIAVVIDRDGLMSSYVDGTFDASTDVSSMSSYDLQSTAPLLLGNYETSGAFFPGLIDDIRIYSSALSASDIAKLAAGNEPTTSPTHKWTFDTNVTPCGADGVRYGGIKDSRSADVPAVLGSGYSGRFDGVDDYVDCGVPFTTNQTKISVSYWLKADFSSFTKDVVYFGITDTSLTSQYILTHKQYYESSDPAHSRHDFFFQDDSGTAGWWGFYITETPDNTWLHIAIVFDNGTPKVFVDGVEKTLTHIGGGNPTYIFGGKTLNIGRDNDNLLRYAECQIDDFRIYEGVALSASDIAKLAAGNEASVQPKHKWSFDATRSIPYLSSSKAIEFDGNSAAKIDAPVATISGDWSVSFWSLAYSATNDQYLGQFYQTSDRLSFIVGYQDGYYNIFPYPTGTASDSQIPCDGSYWDHVVWTKTGSTIRGYVNGVLYCTVTDTQNLHVITPFTLGRPYSTAVNSLYGKLTDPRIYNRALSAAEVLQLAEGTDVTDGLVFRLPFDDPSIGTFLPDATMTSFEDIDVVHKELDISPTFSAVVEESHTGSGGLLPIVKDSVGSADGAFYHNARQNVSSDVPTALGSGYSGKFDGVHDYVDCGNDSSLNPTDGITISAWIKVTAHDSAPTICARWYTVTGRAYWFGLISGKPRFVINNHVTYIDYPTTVPLKQWVHIAGTWDQANGIKLYVDGVYGGTIVGLASRINSVNAETDIGAERGGTGGIRGLFAGLIDDVRIYDSALSASDVALLAAGNEASVQPKHKWTFDENVEPCGHDGLYRGLLGDSRSTDIPAVLDDGFSLRCDGNRYATTEIIQPTQVTWAFWVYNPSPQNGGCGCSSTTDDNVRFSCHPGYTSGWLYWDFGDLSSGSRLGADFNSHFGKWTHVALTSNGVDKTQIYLDGALVAESANASKPTNLAPFEIGRLHLNVTGTNYNFNGKFDDMRIYESVLSAADIAKLAQGKEASVAPDYHWDFDERRKAVGYLAGSKAIAIPKGSTGRLVHAPYTFAATDSWSWAGWVIDPELDQLGTLAGGLNSGKQQLTLRYSPLRVVLYDDAYVQHAITPKIIDQTVHHICVTYEAGSIRTYIDGVYQQTTSVSTAMAFHGLGNTYSSYQYPLLGGLVDPRLYQRALTPGEAMALADGVDITDGLVAHWPFNEQPRSVPNVSGGLALKFNGSSDYVDCGDDTSFNAADKWMTVSAWVKTSGSNLVVVAKGYDSYGGFALIVSSYLQFAAKKAGDATTYVRKNGSKALNDGAWHYVSAVFYLSTTDNNQTSIKLYVDGIEDVGTYETAPNGTYGNSPDRLLVGARGAGSSPFFVGLIDDVRIYNTALSASDIADLYQGVDPSATPIAHWKFDDGVQVLSSSVGPGDAITTWISRDSSHSMLKQTGMTNRPVGYRDSLGNMWVEFDGVDDYLISDKPLLKGTVGAIFAKVQRASSDRMAIISQASTANDNTRLAFINFLDVLGNKPMIIAENGAAGDWVEGDSALDTDSHVLAVVSDGGQYRFWIDNVEVTAYITAGNNSGNWFDNVTGTENTAVGIIKGLTEMYPYAGRIQRLLVYSRLPSDAEVSRINRMLMGYQLPGQDYLLTVDPDLDLDPEYGLGTAGARQLDSDLKQGFQLASRIDPGTKDFWFAGWVKPGVDSHQILISTGGWFTSVYGFTVLANQTQVIGQLAKIGSTVRPNVIYNFPETKTDWYFITVLFDRDGDCKIYIDGQLCASGDISTEAGDLGAYQHKTEIGSRLSYSSHYPWCFNGPISRFCYGEGTLPTEAEITQLYNRGQGLTYAELPSALEAKVTHYWNCMEGSDGTSHVPLYDAKGSNDGTEYGGELLTDGGLENWDHAGGTEFISNGDFETAGFADWTQNAGSGAIADETSLVHGGSHAAKLSYVTGEASISQTFTVTPKVKYTLGFYTAGDGTVGGQYRVHDDTNGADIIAKTSTGVTANSYSTCSKHFDTPAGCTSVTITLYSPSSAGDAYFDDVRCIDNGALFNWAPYADDSFASVTREDTDTHSGSYAMKITNYGDQVNNYRGISQIVGVINSSRTFDASVYAKKADSDNQVFIFIGIGSYTIRNLTSSWQKYTLTKVGGTNSVFYTGLRIQNTGSIYIDDVSLKSPYIPSAEGPRQATAEDSVGDNTGVLTGFSDTTTPWKTDTPDGSYTATKADSVGSNDGTMVDFDDVDEAHVDHNIDGTFGAIIYDTGTSPANGTRYGGLADSRSADVPATLGSGYSGRFDGSDDYVDCGNNCDIGTGKLTVAFWMKATLPSSGNVRYVQKRGTGTFGAQAGWQISGGYGYTFSNTAMDDGNGNYVTVNSGNWGFIQNTWQHWAVVFDPANKDIKIYCDGVDQHATLVVTGDISASNIETSRILTFGNAWDSETTQSQFLNGLLDDVRIYDSALSASDIAKLAAGNEPSTAPKHRWTFDETRSISYLSSSKAIEFDGSAGHIRVTHDSVLDPTTGLTYALWADIKFDGSGKFLIQKNDGNTSPYYNKCIFTTLTNKLRFQLYNGTVYKVDVSGISDGIHHIAWTVEPGGNMVAYIDGIAKSTLASLPSDVLKVDTKDLIVGARINGGSVDGFYDRFITDPRIYNKALSAAEVLQLAEGTDVTDGLVWRLPFDDAPRSVPNVAGGMSLEFDGTDDYVDCPACLEFDYTDTFTLCGWIKSDGSSRNFIVTSFNGTYGIALETKSPTGYPRIYVQAADVKATAAYSKICVTDNSWHHIVAVYDQTFPEDVKLYVDGVLVPNTMEFTDQLSSTLATGVTRIGCDARATPIYTTGLIDDVRIYDAPLSATDIANLYAGTDPSATPIAHWKLDDGPQGGTLGVGDYIATWQSREGNRYIFSQPTAVRRPTLYLDGNGKRWLDFDGTDDYLSIAQAILNGKEGAVFVVVDVDDAASENCFIASSDAGSVAYAMKIETTGGNALRTYQKNNDTSDYLYSGTVGTSPVVVAVVSDGAKIRHYLNGIQQTITVVSGSNNGDWFGDTENRDNLVIGAEVNSGGAIELMDGKIARILAFDRQLTADKVKKISTELKIRYGIS